MPDQGAFVVLSNQTFSIDLTKVKSAIAALDHNLLTVEAQGDYAGAKKMLDELGMIRPELKQALPKARRHSDRHSADLHDR